MTSCHNMANDRCTPEHLTVDSSEIAEGHMDPGIGISGEPSESAACRGKTFAIRLHKFVSPSGEVVG